MIITIMNIIIVLVHHLKVEIQCPGELVVGVVLIFTTSIVINADDAIDNPLLLLFFITITMSLLTY